MAYSSERIRCMVTVEVIAIIDGVVWLSVYVDSGDDSMDESYASMLYDETIFDAVRDVLRRARLTL